MWCYAMQARDAFARRPEFQLHVLLAHPPQLAAGSQAGRESFRGRAMIYNGEPIDPLTIDGILEAVLEPEGKCPRSPVLL